MAKGTRVLLSYHGDAFTRLKPKNREKRQALAKAGRIGNDAVIVSAGASLANSFLQSIESAVETRYGTASFLRLSHTGDPKP